jgi:hypothetical protein
MHIKIHQIDKEKDKSRVGFLDLKRTTELSGKVNPSIYKTVFDGEVDCKSWGEIFTLFNSSEIPFTHQGRSLSVSDVVEVKEAPVLVGRIKFYVSDDVYQIVNYIDSDKYNYDIYEARKSGRRIEAKCLKDKNILSINPGTYFCDLQDFKKIDFDNSRVAPMEGKRMLIIEPHKAPYEAIVKDDFRAVQKVVGGTFECVYPFFDDAFMFVNEEGKLIGLEGNRMVNGDIIAGNILIACDDGMGRTKDLSNEQVEKYKKQFEADEVYTQDEVQGSAYMFYIGI